jgi:type IV secretion system protein VirB10
VTDATDALPGERQVSPVAGRPWLSRRHGAILIGLAGVCVAIWFVLHNGPATKREPAGQQTTTIRQVSAFEPPPETLAPPPSPPPQAQPQRQQTLLQQVAGRLTVDDPLAKARAAPLLRGSDGQQQQPAAMPAAVTAAAPPEKAAAAPASPLAAGLHTTILDPAVATVLPHPTLTVTMGTLIPCVLQTAMDSSAAGIVTCVTQQDVLGSTGSVVLMEKGTRMVGEYANRMQQGQDRLFVLWNRAETPNHVVITLGSPGADALGRAGFDGQIDTHFWARFGGALMLTVVDGAFGAATAVASQHGGTYLNFGAGQSAATEALQNTINIPPTIRKNQGDVVAVMVARDLDFSQVYALRLTR